MEAYNIPMLQKCAHCGEKKAEEIEYGVFWCLGCGEFSISPKRKAIFTAVFPLGGWITPKKNEEKHENI